VDLAGHGCAKSDVRVNIYIAKTSTLFADNFIRCPSPGTLAPWQVYWGSGVLGQWGLTNEVLQGSSAVLNRYGYCYLSTSWPDYSVEATIRFSATNAYGGGLGGRLNPATGGHYAAWVYPEGSPGGSNVLGLVKFSTWTDWDYGGSPVFMAQTNLASVGTSWHTLRLRFNGNQIDVYYDDLVNPKISMSDAYSPVYTNGAVSLDMWTGATIYTMSVDDVIVRP